VGRPMRYSQKLQALLRAVPPQQVQTCVSSLGSPVVFAPKRRTEKAGPDWADSQ
jgi:hypothetical protein